MISNRAITTLVFATFMACVIQPTNGMNFVNNCITNVKDFCGQSQLVYTYWNSPAFEQILLFEEKVQEYEKYLQRWYRMVHEGGPNYRYIKGDWHHQCADELYAIAQKGLRNDPKGLISYLTNNFFDRFNKDLGTFPLLDNPFVLPDEARAPVIFFQKLIKNTRLLDEALAGKYLKDFAAYLPWDISRARDAWDEEKSKTHYIFSEGKLKILSTLLKYSNQSEKFLEHISNGFELFSIGYPKIVRRIIEKNPAVCELLVKKYQKLSYHAYGNHDRNNPIIKLVPRHIPHFNEKTIEYALTTTPNNSITLNLMKIYKKYSAKYKGNPGLYSRYQTAKERIPSSHGLSDHEYQWYYKPEQFYKSVFMRQHLLDKFGVNISLVDSFYITIFPFLMNNCSSFITPIFSLLEKTAYEDGDNNQVRIHILEYLFKEYPETHPLLCNKMSSLLQTLSTKEEDCPILKMLSPLIENIALTDSPAAYSFARSCVPFLPALAQKSGGKRSASLLQSKYGIPRKKVEADRLSHLIKIKEPPITSLTSVRTDHNENNDFYARARDRAYLIGKQINPQIKDYNEFTDDVRAHVVQVRAAVILGHINYQ
jgi:hypothetical protein